MDGSWDDCAEGWEDQPGVKTYSENAFKALSSIHSPFQGCERILDFGCGTGLLTEKLAPLVQEVVAIDASSNMVEILIKKKISNVVPATFILSSDTINTEEVLCRGKFDLIVASSVLLFVDNYEETLCLLRSLLASGGKFVQWDWFASSSDSFGFTEERVQSAYAKCGLTLVAPISKPWQLEGENNEMMTVFMAVGECSTT